MPLSENGLAAFRCRNCGHLEGAGAAGVCPTPHACSVCSRGVVFAHNLEAALAHPHLEPHREALAAVSEADMRKPFHQGGRVSFTKLQEGVEICKLVVPENWEALADAPPERLAELGLTPEQVERHDPAAAEAEGGGQSSASRGRLVVVDAQDGPKSEDSAG